MVADRPAPRSPSPSPDGGASARAAATAANEERKAAEAFLFTVFYGADNADEARRSFKASPQLIEWVQRVRQ